MDKNNEISNFESGGAENSEIFVVENENYVRHGLEFGNSIESFEQFNIKNEELMELQGVEDVDGVQYVYYDEAGQAYIMDPNTNESNVVDIYDNNENGCIAYNCPLCAQVFYNANAFTKHTRDIHFVKVFTCRQCEQFFDNLSLLFLHARRTHSDPRKPTKDPASYKFHCPDCDYMTNNGGTMEHHRRAHSGIKPYKCDICEKTFAQKANMKTHRNRHIHKDRIFLCETCNKSFNSHDIYLAHLRTREHELHEHFQMTIKSRIRIQCMGCNEEFNCCYDVNNHLRSCTILKELTNKFWCIECKAGFPTYTSLKTHLKAHGGNQVIKCPVCNESGFPGVNQLNHHITRAHALKVNRRNVCRYCEMTFETKLVLDRHIDEMHACEKNARQSRGTAGRLRCRYSMCDFTSNSVMLMDRHHDQHISNTLPSNKRVVKRPRKILKPLLKEEMVEPEIERMYTEFMDNEVLRPCEGPCNNGDFCDEVCDNRGHIKLESMGPLEEDINEDFIDDMGVDDLERLATFYVEDEPVKTKMSDVKRKRGRPRKCAHVTTADSVKDHSDPSFPSSSQDYPQSHQVDI